MASVTVKTNQLKIPRKVVVRVGVLETGDHPPAEQHEGGLTIGELAEIHEYGLGNCPPRAPIRVTVDGQGVVIQEIARAEFTAAHATKGGLAAYQRAADRVAIKAGAMVRNAITEGLEPEIGWSEGSKAYAKRKEAQGYPPPHTPLVTTGVLRSAYSGDAEVTQ